MQKRQNGCLKRSYKQQRKEQKQKKKKKGCKEYNQSDFDIDLVMSMCKVIFYVVGRGVCHDQCIILAKLCQEKERYIHLNAE